MLFKDIKVNFKSDPEYFLIQSNYFIQEDGKKTEISNYFISIDLYYKEEIIFQNEIIKKK